MQLSKIVMTGLLVSLALYGGESEGLKLFKHYCWGCHHQTAEAFGPSFKTIASKRTKEQIEAMMLDPEAMSKTLGYRRNSMPSFADLNDTQRKALADYILQFKETK